ncbi:hypothetical protein GGTG_05584 [Gaeumannomyces tritici R3-111a-1]|uniref:Uncharacterized protein n=1 Tax=Gaeumannomyces tritici (strain R3-111a-1) TaxID=644352 RepID=J3NWC0_GAET3|nr:hypothetical protein GGTG_05584 [Gaeumannomyces tritici R3-111a-1]EJT75652.1 hypothetical protein GGTG_05584 [Gaeumannomyces tritici R3-111a-1]
MPRLPPAEKLPLALRKNVRDDWENKKEGFEKELTELLGGVEWSLKEINPLAIWPYHNDGYAKESLGSCIAAYVAGAIYQLKYFIQQHGEEEAVKEINEIAYEHSMILDFDEEKKLGSYGGVEIADGRIRLGFAPQCLGTNVDYCIDGTKFAQALNDAAPAPGTSAPMSYLARNDIRMEYDAKIEETRKKLAEMLERPEIKLVPNFEEAFAKMTEAKAKDKKKVMRDDWQQNLGNFVRRYYEGLEYQAKYQKFGEDEMLREGLNEVLESGEFRFRIVDQLKYGSYGEVVVEDGAIYLQCKPDTFGTNVDYVAEKLVDQL